MIEGFLMLPHVQAHISMCWHRDINLTLKLKLCSNFMQAGVMANGQKCPGLLQTLV